jgi:predicted short-subunit dehydrogenase-like oxidoreductase (DUF2520 family)
MNTRQAPLGLVVEGSSVESFTLRLPSIVAGLGPVKSATPRVARRVANRLRAGFPIDSYEELQSAKLILLYVPDTSVTRVVDEICQAELVHRGLSFLLCETWRTTKVLEPLSKRGAAVATSVISSGPPVSSCVLEGDVPVLRKARRFLADDDIRVLNLRPGCKPLYFAAELLATTLPLPLLFDAQSALRSSGIEGKQLYMVEEEMVVRMLRTFRGGARIAWGGPLTECSPETAEGHLSALQEKSPVLASTVSEQLAWARKRLNRPKAR